MREGTVQRAIWLGLAHLARLFRINTGQAWMSNIGERGVRRLEDGSVHILAARPIALGFGMPDGKSLKGTSDLCGWTTVKITSDMVGCRVAVFTAIECKESGGGRKSSDQSNFVDQVRISGGIAGFASSPEEARAIVAGYRPPLIPT